LGVSPGFISRGKLKVENLSEALLQVKQDQQIQARANELGAKIRAEADGVTVAVQTLEKLL
jgi:UDP:flavonoid glycosyltransferase YjiC (YdhE family)